MQRVTLTTRQVKCTTRSTGVKEDEVNEEEGWFLFAERPVGQYRANRGSGKKPTAEMLKQERKIKQQEK
jgi:hypothetical protein